MTLMIAVDAEKLDQLLERVAGIERRLQHVDLAAREEWLAISEAARILCCDPSTIRRKIASGELRAKGNGKSRRVRLD